MSQRTHSPHIADQAMAPAPLRKPLRGGGDHSATSSPTPYHPANNPSVTTSPQSDKASGNNRYQFDNNGTAIDLSDALSPSGGNGTNSARQSAWIDDPALDPSVRLEEYEWAELSQQFERRMEAMRVVEEGIWEEWRGWGEILGAWASTISVHDEERANKRLRTRVAFTQGAEESLEAKRQHYIKVVQAFESALALLGNG